jgi:hypothetical protein
VASTPGPGSKPPLTPILQGFGKPDGKRDAAVSEYGKQFGGSDFELLDDAEDPSEMARRAAGKSATASAKPAPTASAKPAATPVIGTADTSDVRPTLEPISDTTHKHRRIPTQPPSAFALELDIDRPSDPASERAVSERSAARPATSAAAGSVAPSRLPPAHASRQSPAPVRRGLFSGDRVTNLIASVAVGLVIMIYPAKQLARSYELRTVEPMLTDLDGAIDHPLGVQAGLVADPQKIAAQIHEGRDRVRQRYMMIWLLVGLPIGLGLGFAPRPGD